MRRLLLGLALLGFLFLVFYVATGFVDAVLSSLPASPWDVEAIKLQAIGILWLICFLLALAIIAVVAFPV